MSVLGDLLRFGAAPAAGAVGAFDAAKEKKQHDSMLERINSMLAQSQIEENHAHADYFAGIGRQPPARWHETASGDVYNDQSGEIHPGAGTIKPTKHPRPLLNNDQTMMWDDEHGGFVPSGLAAKGPPPEQPDVAAAHKQEAAARSQEADIRTRTILDKRAEDVIDALDAQNPDRAQKGQITAKDYLNYFHGLQRGGTTAYPSERAKGRQQAASVEGLTDAHIQAAMGRLRERRVAGPKKASLVDRINSLGTTPSTTQSASDGTVAPPTTAPGTTQPTSTKHAPGPSPGVNAARERARAALQRQYPDSTPDAIERMLKQVDTGTIQP